MRTFAPLTGADLPVAEALLGALVATFGRPGRWVVIGATARDLALQVGGVDIARRATKDVDLAVAASDLHHFQRQISAIGQPDRAWQRRIVLGQQVDVVPFGGLESEGTVTVDGSTLNVLGLAEAAAYADHLTLPSGGVLPVAPLELIAILKLLAFADRHPGQTKDADDLRIVLQAASHGTYGEEVWDDDEAMSAAEFDHELAGAYRLGRRGIACFPPERASMVLAVVETTEETLWFPRHPEQRILLQAWRAGLRHHASGAVHTDGGT